MSFHLLFKNEDSFSEFSIYNEEGKLSYLPSCQAINIFIGSNNSGKSRFLRRAMSNKEFIFVDSEKIKRYDNVVIEFNNRYAPGFNNTQLQIIPRKFSAINHIHKSNNYNIENSPYDIRRLYITAINEIGTNFIVENKSKRYYIPTLRTAHTLLSESKKIDNDIYSETLVANHGLDKKDITIFTGLHLYKQILRSRNSDKDVRERFDLFEEFLSKSFFDGKRVDVVANFDPDLRSEGKSDSELILIHVEGENKTRKLFDLGDGVQAIVILMYQIFMADDNSMVFIDEPELHMHPGMQRLFLEQLCSNEDLKKKNLIYFITTHSNHFLDLTIEKDNVSIYSFSTQLQESGDKKFTIKNVNAGDNELLQNLGVNNSSVFMANCSIWVEGISDRNYIKAFLKAYSAYLLESGESEFRSIKEDIDYAFFEYSGSNIEHYFFRDLGEEQEKEILEGVNAMALNNRILLLADSDNAKGNTKKGIRLKRFEDQETENFVPKIIRNIREIENLLTNSIWKNTIIEFCNSKLLKSQEDSIKKRIDTAFNTYNSSNNPKEYIGNFLNAIDKNLGTINGINILNKIYEIKTDGTFGTFIQKRELSEIVLKKTMNGDFTWETFRENKEIVQLTKSIYNFITKTM